MKKFVGEEIYRAIPNRYPLMILDTLIVEAGIKASGYMELTQDQWFFQCHFPGIPIMPATLLAETMTQVFISIFLPEQEERSGTDGWKQEDIPILVQIGGFKMRQALLPGDVVRIDAYLHSFRRGIAQGKCAAFKISADGAGAETLVTEFEVSHALPSAITAPRPRSKK